MAAAQQAALKAKWMVALKTLKGIPAAAADRSLPKKDLHYRASQAEVHCSCATYNTSPGQMSLHCQKQLRPAFKLIIHKLQIPLHIGKAAATLLPIPFTFHMATELLRHLTMLTQAVQYENPGDPSTPGLLAAISTQVAASGLLQQLPDALKTAQQQLQVLKPTGWCGGRCHFCERHMSHATGLGLADTGSYALQETLLKFCNDLLAIWPGTLGALGSTAACPVLLPVAKLALSSLQYVCRQAGELHTSSSSTPPQALVDLGRTALGTCAALTRTADTVSQGSLGPGGLQPVSGLPSGANALLSSPEMLSVLAATFNADVYGAYDQDSVSAASAPVVPDLSNPLPMVYMQAPVTPDGNLPAAAWRQLCGRERRLEPGQDLLPPLQAQLLGTLGCNSKGFLWLAPLWKYRQSLPGSPAGSHCLYSTTLPSLLVVASSMKARMSSTGASGSTSAAMDVALQQFLLLPVLMLRRELNKQQASSGSDADAGVFNSLRASTSCLPILQLWRDLHDQVASTRAGAAAGSSSTAGAYRDGVSHEGLIQLAPILHEMLQLLAHLLLGFMQMPQPGSSSSGKSSGGSTSQGSVSAKHSSESVSPAAAVTAVSCVIAVLLPLATQAIMAQADSASAGDTTATSSSRGGSIGSSGTGSSGSTASSSKSSATSLAATWVPMLVRLTAVLERAMRLEAKWGPTQPELLATDLFDGFGDVAGDGPKGSAAWLATFMLLSPAAHKQYGWLYGERKGYETPLEDRHALLQWMLDNTPPEQLPAVHQRLLSVLCTTSKLSLSAKDSKQLTQANQAYKSVLHIALQVLDQLLPPTADSSLQAARAAAKAEAAAAAHQRREDARSAAAAKSQDRAVSGRSLSDTVTASDLISDLITLVQRMGCMQDMPPIPLRPGLLPDQGTASSSQASAKARAAASSSSNQDSNLGLQLLASFLGPAIPYTQAAAGSSSDHPDEEADQGPGSAPTAAAAKGQAAAASSGSQASGAEPAPAMGDDASGGSSQDAGRAPAPSKGPNSASSSSILSSASTTGKESASTVKVNSDAVMSWLLLLGRCFVQACQQLTSRLEQHAAGSEIGSAPCIQCQRQRTQQEKARDRAWTSKELRSMYDLNAHDIPRCIVRVAVLLSAAAGAPQQQLPKQIPVQRPATGKLPLEYESVDKALSAPDWELQQLRGAGQQLGQHCSSLGLDLTAIQQSSWALAGAAAAAAAVFHAGYGWNVGTASGLEALDPRGVVGMPDGMLLQELLQFGLTMDQAREAVDTPYQGVRGCPEMTALAILHSPPAQTYMKQLKAAGLALSTLPTAAACNNPHCASLSGASEQGVSCKACSACHLAVYCQRSCQKQHWGVHKPVCQAVQAAAAAAAAGATGSSV